MELNLVLLLRLLKMEVVLNWKVDRVGIDVLML